MRSYAEEPIPAAAVRTKAAVSRGGDVCYSSSKEALVGRLVWITIDTALQVTDWEQAGMDA